ncbi:MAG: ATP-binding protein [Phycisphaerales bacterium]
MTLPKNATRVAVPNERSCADAIVDDIINRLENHGFDPTSIFAIRLAVEEALANAMQHGNRCDPKKSIRVGYHITPEDALIEIEDDGPGFNPHTVPDPTEEANIEIPSGRGLMLMRAYMTDVEYNACGNSVAMRYVRKCAS